MNLAELMKAAQDMQSKMADAQAALDKIFVTGESGAGMVKATANARGKITALSIDPSLLVPADVEILEDLIIAAITTVQRRAEETGQAEMGKLTAGLPLPPGMKLPL